MLTFAVVNEELLLYLAGRGVFRMLQICLLRQRVKALYGAGVSFNIYLMGGRIVRQDVKEIMRSRVGRGPLPARCLLQAGPPMLRTDD